MPQILAAESAIDSGRRIATAYGAKLRPFIFGPKAGLHRYSVAAEKALISLGSYDANQHVAYSYPEKVTGSVIDLSYAKLYLDDAYLQYFAKFVGVGSGTIAPVSSYNNRVRASATSFKSYTNTAGTAFARSGDFYDRDVEVGDVVRVRGTVGSQSTTHTTSVYGFVNEVVAAVIGSAAADADNATSQTLDSSISQVSGTPVNEVVATADASAYDGLADGDINETYTITVTQSSTGSDATTGLLQVVSASGNDNQTSVEPAAFASPTAIGTRGLEVTFALSGPGTSESIDQNDLVVGQQWVVSVEQAFTPATAASAGTPTTGMPTTTYIVTVTRGGTFVDPTPPQVTISTTTGVDVSGPSNVASATAVAVGTYGVTVAFTGSSLRKGDIYHIPVTGVQKGAYKTLVLKDSIPDALLDATDLDLWLFIEKDGYLVTEDRIPSPPSKNWIATTNNFTVRSGITVYEDSWTDDGVPLALPIVEGTLYLEYREWLTSGALTIENIQDVNSVESVFGVVDPDNPIAYAVDKSLRNTGLTNLAGASAVTLDTTRACWLAGSPDELENWTDVLDLIEGVEDIYNLVPLSVDQDVLDAVVAHVASESAAEIGAFRAAIVQLTAPETQTICEANSDDSVILATLVQDPDSDAVAYTKFIVADQTPGFVTNGVAVGDTVRYFYTTDGFGNETYTEFTIAEVVSEDTLIVETSHTVAVTTAQKLVVVRYPSKAQVVSDLTAQAAAYSDSRVLALWPDTIGDAGQEVPGYFLAAALAGLMGSIPPHQPLTNVGVLGFDSVTRSKDFFTNKQLQQLADGGVFVVNEAVDGTIYVRKAWTSDSGSTIGNREEAARRNTDAIRYAILESWGNYIGNANNIPTTYTSMYGDFTGVVGALRSDTFLPRLGSMALSGSIVELRPHTVLADRAVANITMQVPYPLNTIELAVVI